MKLKPINLVTPIQLDSGIIASPAIFESPKSTNRFAVHPITKQRIFSFKIPAWGACGKVTGLFESASLVVPEVETGGWDIAIGEDDVLLIEGNDSCARICFNCRKIKDIRELNRATLIKQIAR